jgi:hypothetical protein
MNYFKNENERIEYMKKMSPYHFDPFLKEHPFQIVGWFTNADWMSEVRALEKANNGGTKFGFVNYRWNDGKYGHQFSLDDKKEHTFPQDHVFIRRIPKQSMSRETAPTIYKMADWFALGEDSFNLKVQIQHPGQVFPIHVDGLRKGKQSKEIEKEMQAHPERWVRVNIQLQDWTWGQMWSIGNSNWTQWRAGEIMFHPWWTIPHATANASYLPRYTMQVTGRATATTFDRISRVHQQIDLSL